jgi:predicted nucleotidyltransferase
MRGSEDLRSVCRLGGHSETESAAIHSGEGGVCDFGSVAIQLCQTEEGSLDMRAARLDQILREFRDGLEQIYGSRLIRVVLFGSQARDEAEPDSDIDVMVVLRGPVNPHEEIRRLSVFKAELCLRYDVVVSCVYVSEAEYRQDGTPLMLTVRREGIPV